MRPNKFSQLLAFLERLDQAKIPYSMRHSRDDAVMIVAFAPGEYWEIEFLENDEIEIERYRSNGRIEDESVLEQLFALWAEAEPSPEQAVIGDDKTARN